MKVGIVSSDIKLFNKIKNVEQFKDTSMGTIEEFKGIDVLIASDKIVSLNDLLEQQEIYHKNTKHIFFMVSKKLNNSEENILKSKNIKIIPPRLTESQIVEKIVSEVLEEVKIEKNIIVYFGADSKVGTTQVVQGVAETLANNSNAKVCLLFLNGKPGADYINTNESMGLDYIRVKLTNNILTIKELQDIFIKKGNLSILLGANSIIDARHYHPKHIERLIDIIAPEFDVVLIDAGSNVELGMTIGALNSTKYRYLVTTQQELVRKNFNRVQEQVLTKLGIDDFIVIVNKCIDTAELYTSYQIAELHNLTHGGHLPLLDLAWQSESDKKTLIHYGEEDYNRQIEKCCVMTANLMNIQFNETVIEEKSTWFKWPFKRNRGDN